MGGGLSTRSGDADKRHHQELIDKYWSLKESIEDRTVKFLRCVDILESASIHILSCNEKTKGRDIALARDPYTRKLLSNSKVLEEGEKKTFVREIVEFLEFVSQKIQELQEGNDHRDVTCSTIRKYKKSSDGIEDTKDTVDGPETLLEDFQLQIKKLEEENKMFKVENAGLQSLVDSLEKSDKEHIKLNHYKEKEIKKLRNDLQDYEKKNKSENENKVLELQNKLIIEGLEKSVDSLKKDKELMQDEISKLETRLEVKDLQYNTKISKLSQEVADMKNDIADLLKKHGKELDNMYDEKFVAELKWIELKDNVNAKFQKEIELKDKLRKLERVNDDVGVLERELTQKKLDFKQCYDEKLEFETALRETRDELGLYKEKIKQSEENLNQAFVKLEKYVEDNKKLRTKLHQSCDDNKELKTKLNQSCDDNKELKTKLNQSCDDNKELKTKLNQSCDDNKELKTKLNQSCDDNKELKTKLNQSCDDNKELKTKFEQCVKDKNEIDSKLKQSVKKHEMCINERQKLEKKIISLQDKHKTELSNLEQTLRNCRSEKERLSVELSDMEKKRILKVKLFSVRRPNTVSDFEDAVIAMLKSKIDDDVRELKFEQQNNPGDVNIDTDPTIVLCFCGSRIGTDAEKAVEGLNLSPKMALVMIHHKDVHALPQQLSERVITGQEFKKLDCITDMAFLRDKGIFPCEINNNSLVKLVNFIKQKGIEYNKY